METTKQKRCDECIHYHKDTRRMGYCQTNANKIFIKPLFNKDGKEIKSYITTKSSNYCELHFSNKSIAEV